MFTVVELTLVVVPFTVKSPAIVTPPLNVAVSSDWLPIVKLPPKSEFNAVAISAPVWSAVALSSIPSNLSC